MLSNESYMKRVMRLVFPTDCSPRKTSLNFRRGLAVKSVVMVGFLYFLDFSEDSSSRVSSA